MRWLGSKRLNWRDLLVIVKHSPEGSALFRSVHGSEDSEWTLTNHLLAALADSAAWLVWSKTEDASRKRNRPKPIQRPGITDDSKKQIGSGSLGVEDMKSWLGGDFVNLN